MANTYTQMYIQAVFAVQNRMSLIKNSWKDELYKYITGIVQNNGHKMIAINGVENHIHIFIGYKPHQLVPDLIKDVKGCSSKWINEREFVKGKFNWQEGYGAFTYSHSHIDNVAQYVMNQENHHQKKSFHEEYVEFLKRFNIDFDEKYILKDIN